MIQKHEKLIAYSIIALIVLASAEPSNADQTSVQQTQQENTYTGNTYNTTDSSDRSYKVTTTAGDTSNSHNYSVWQQNRSEQNTTQVEQNIKQEGVIGNGNNINSGTNAGGGDITAKGYGGDGGDGGASNSESKAVSGDSSAKANSEQQIAGSGNGTGIGGQSSIQTGSTNLSFNSASNYRNYVAAPNLSALVGYVSQNDDMCRYSNGGSASGSNGMGGGGLSLLFGFSDGHCEMLKQVKFLIAGNDFYGACELILIYDQEEKDGYFAKAMSRTGGCIKFRQVVQTFAPSVAPVTPLALDTQRRLNSLKPANSLIDQAFNQGMVK